MSEFPNCEIKLCDLEVSRVIQDHEQIREIIGTPDYVGTDDIEKYHRKYSDFKKKYSQKIVPFKLIKSEATMNGGSSIALITIT